MAVRARLFGLRLVGLTGLLAAIAVGAGAEALAQASDGPRMTGLEIGLGGRFKVGYWTPVRVSVSGGAQGFSGNVELIAPDGDDVSTRFVLEGAAAVEVSPGGEWTGWRYVKLGRVGGKVRAVLRAGDGTVCDDRTVEAAAPAPSSWQWVLNVGADVGVEEATVFLARERGEKPMLSLVSLPEQFPDRWYGYEGVDVMIVPTGTESPLEKLSDSQFSAVLRWLQLGGRMVYSAGRRAGELSREASRFRPFRAGDFEELDEHWKASGLENLARASDRLTNPDGAPLAVFRAVRGNVVCYEGAGGANDRPLVVQYPYGFGEITYVAMDLELSPLAQWAARPRLLAKLLQTRSDDEDSSPGSEGSGEVTHYGYDDIFGQMRAALDQFSRVTLVRFSWVAALLVLYVALLGPIDFFGLRKLRRMQWTWVTFPLTVLAFGALAMWLSQVWKGDRLAINQFDIVDIDQEHEMARGTTCANIYSPQSSRLDVTLSATPACDTAADRTGILLSWQGLPGSGMGGMNTTARVDVLSDEYTIWSDGTDPPAQQTGIRGLPVRTSSTKGLLCRWWTAVPSLPASQLTVRERGFLRGTIVNPLKVELSQCYVYHENWAYPLAGRLRPGDSVELDNTSPLDLKWQLTRRQIVQSKDISTPWDRADLSDPPRVAQMLMFHGAAGGQVYTRLSHHFLGYLDLSKHLLTGRAILVGRSKTPASQLARDGQPLVENMDQQWTYYRIIIPVERSVEP